VKNFQRNGFRKSYEILYKKGNKKMNLQEIDKNTNTVEDFIAECLN